jgi:hypothetical protein
VKGIGKLYGGLWCLFSDGAIDPRMSWPAMLSIDWLRANLWDSIVRHPVVAQSAQWLLGSPLRMRRRGANSADRAAGIMGRRTMLLATMGAARNRSREPRRRPDKAQSNCRSPCKML